ncbi:MAG TPA: LPS assembly lipoprotein LptE [Candidatus Omnitrophota bacterium]|nr:LPS assembly lipoprotein LptE [Candidatus Omnitrophota bacterium]
MKKNILTVLTLTAVLIAGCGYTTRSSLPGHLRTIHIAPIDNKIVYTSSTSREVYFPLLEVDARNAIIDRFQFDGNLRFVNEDDADLVLKGSLLNYQRHGLRFSDDDVAEEYRVQVVVSLEMFDTQKNEMMWQEPRFVGEATFFLSGPEATSEESAVQEAIEDLARRVVERTVENW